MNPHPPPLTEPQIRLKVKRSLDTWGLVYV